MGFTSDSFAGAAPPAPIVGPTVTQDVDLDTLLATARSDGADDGSLYITNAGVIYRKYTVPDNSTKVLLPGDLYDSVTGMISINGGANGLFMDMNTDDVAGITARGIVPSVGNSGGVNVGSATKVGNNLVLDSNVGTFPYAKITAIPVSSPTKYLLVYKAQAQLTDNATNSVAQYLTLNGRRVRTTYDTAEASQLGGFVSPTASTTVVGNGRVTTSGGKRWYFMMLDSASDVSWWSESNEERSMLSSNTVATVPYGTVTNAGVLSATIEFWALSVAGQVITNIEELYGFVLS